MKKIKILSFASVISFTIVTTLALSGITVFAALVPNLSLTSVAGSPSVQVTVFGADANSSVLLYYPSTSSFTSTNIGTTNGSGYLTTTVDSTNRNITAGSQVYVGVNGSQSQQTAWPNYTTAGGLSFSQSIVNVNAGQSMVVSAALSATLSVSNNTNPTVASATISGNQITVNGLSAGTSNITICAPNIGCGIIYVTVNASSANTSPISITPSTVNLTIGQGTTVTISGGSGSYYVNTSSNQAVASSNISGANMNINAIMSGSTNIGVCTQGSNNTSCGSVTVYVTGTSVNTNSLANQQNQKLSFSQAEVSLAIGQKQTVAIYGGAYGSTAYYVQANSTPGSVTANINGANLDLIGAAFGGANVNVCQVGGTLCGSVYAFVSSNTTVAPTITNTTAPALASFTASSNNASGSFLGSGNVLTFSMTANQAISTPVITIDGKAIATTGSGTGPYVATYTLTDNRAALPIFISFNNLTGTAGQAKFSVGDTEAKGVVSVPSTASSQTSVSSNKILSPLKSGSTGAEVTLLQQRLTALGVYAGPITGTFGAKTEAAVKKLQSKFKLTPLGSVGPATRALLNK